MWLLKLKTSSTFDPFNHCEFPPGTLRHVQRLVRTSSHRPRLDFRSGAKKHLPDILYYFTFPFLYYTLSNSFYSKILIFIFAIYPSYLIYNSCNSSILFFVIVKVVFIRLAIPVIRSCK